MNGKTINVLVFIAVIVLAASLAEAHKKFYSAPQYQGPQQERCVCDCGGRQPILPNKPYYGSGGYAQQPPRNSGGYGSSGSYAVAESYGSGAGQVNGAY